MEAQSAGLSDVHQNHLCLHQVIINPIELLFLKVCMILKEQESKIKVNFAKISLSGFQRLSSPGDMQKLYCAV